jgi:small-conductance mechanosensitive channel
MRMGEQTAAALWAWLAGHGIRVLLIILAAVLAVRALEAAMGRLEHVITSRGERVLHEQRRRAVTLANIFRSTGLIVIFVVSGLLVLEEFSLDITPLLAGASVVGLAIGLGAQTLVRDMIGGLFVLIEDQYHIGDTVRVAGVTGTVEDISLRATHLRDADGTLHLVPNGEIRIVSNATSGWSRAIVDVRVPYTQDIGRVMQALNAAVVAANEDPEIKPLLLEALTVAGVEALEADSMRLRVMGKTHEGRQEAVNRAVRRHIRERFEADAISAPPAAAA